MPLTDSTRLLALARTDPAAARAALSSLSAEEQAAVVCRTPIEERRRIVEMLTTPAEVVPLLPEIELCATAKGMGLPEAATLLRHATDGQIVAALDLDAWKGQEPETRAIGAWLEGLAMAGDATLLRGMESLDVELVALFLREHLEVFQKENDEGWEQPSGCHSVDGQVFVRALGTGDDIALPLHLLRVAFTEDRSLYFRLIQLILWELPAELEEWALRWREGRLIDMGFPTWERAMSIYAFLRPEERFRMPDATRPTAPMAAAKAHARSLVLPHRGASVHALFEAIDELEDEPRCAAFVAFLEVTNQVLVADRSPLGDIETMRVAMEKVAKLASQGLEAVAEANDVGEAEVLRRLTLEHLFRVGASLQERPGRTA